MTQAQKRLFGGLKSPMQREEFIQMIRDQQDRMGGYLNWEAGYGAKCASLTDGSDGRAADMRVG